MSADPVDPEILANFDNFRTKKLNYFAKLTSFFCTSVSHSSSSNQRRPRNLAMLDMGCSFCFWMIHFRWNAIHISNIVSYSEIPDTGMRGRVVNVSVGRDSVGSFSVIGALHSADGDIAIYFISKYSEVLYR